MTTERKEPIRLTIAQILEDLDNGLTRAGIGQKYDLSGADVSRLFQHAELKGKKTKALPNFIIVSEAEGNEPNNSDTVESTTTDQTEMELEQSDTLY